jgi:transposase-like protein
MRYLLRMATKKHTVHTTKPTLTLGQVERMFSTEEECRALLRDLRWPNGVACPRCGDDKRIYRAGEDFRWKCKSCNKNGYRFTVLTGSVFENTNIPLKTWFRVAFLMVSSKKGISALQVHRMIDPVRGSKGSYKTALYMTHRIRAAMKENGGPLGGIVEMDETYVGGKDKNRHAKDRTHSARAKKIPVVGAIARKGNVVCQRIERASAIELARFARKTVSSDVELIATDENPAYNRLVLKDGFLRHETVNHTDGQYVNGVVHTANLDSFWALLKRGIIGTFHKVSYRNLPLYLNEFSWRHNHRHDPNIFFSVLAGC